VAFVTLVEINLNLPLPKVPATMATAMAADQEEVVVAGEDLVHRPEG
jgi:hypothetical protein